MLEQLANLVLRIQSPQFTIIVNLQIHPSLRFITMSSFPFQPANNATSATGQGPDFKDQTRDSAARGGATAPSVPNKASSPSSPGGGPAFKDQMRHADPPRPPASDRPPTVPLAEATPVNPSAIEREGGDERTNHVSVGTRETPVGTGTPRIATAATVKQQHRNDYKEAMADCWPCYLLW